MSETTWSIAASVAEVVAAFAWVGAALYEVRTRRRENRLLRRLEDKEVKE